MAAGATRVIEVDSSRLRYSAGVSPSTQPSGAHHVSGSETHGLSPPAMLQFDDFRKRFSDRFESLKMNFVASEA